MTGVFSLAIWVNAKTFGVLITFALVGGLSAGIFWVNAAPVIVEVMGIENLASGLSILWVAMVIPSTFSEPIAVEIYLGTGSYLGAQLFTGFMFVAASLCMLVLRGWQINRGRRNDDGTFTCFEEHHGERKEAGQKTVSLLKCFKWEKV
jgi:predicted MFS family arabinose efflux permease